MCRKWVHTVGETNPGNGLVDETLFGHLQTGWNDRKFSLENYVCTMSLLFRTKSVGAASKTGPTQNGTSKIAVPILCFTLHCMPLTFFCIPVVAHTWTHLFPQYFIAPILYSTHTHTPGSTPLPSHSNSTTTHYTVF